MSEIDLMRLYPKNKKPIDERGLHATETSKVTARKYGPEYYDGDRLTGYGGYSYHPRFWTDTVRLFRDHYQLVPDASVLDIGCAKGFMMHDFKLLMPELTIRGLDISSYAKENAIEDMKPFIDVGSAASLPYDDNSFDLVVSISTMHNLPLEECRAAIKEIQRVSRQHAFVTVASWRNDYERQQALKWNLTALTLMHVDDWKRLFTEAGYTGDFWWFIP